MSLYNKYRPTTWEGTNGLIGNDKIKKQLDQLVKQSPLERPQVFLFTGPTGCGKTTIGRILASNLGCDIEYDLQEFVSADFRGIHTIRDIRRNMYLRPMGVGDNRVWILDECHNLTNDAQNALLKALEHPPSHVYFILCTDQPECLLAPLKGRCILYKVKPLNHTEELPLLLNRIARKEGKEFKKDDALQFIKDIKEEAEEEAKEIAERKGLKEKDTKAAISLARKQACHPRNAIQALAKVLPTLPDKKKE